MFNFFKKKKNTSQPNLLLFNVNPQKYKHCREYLARLTTFLDIESNFRSKYYIAINNDDGNLYEIHTRVIGYEGATIHTEKVLDFVFEPRKITIKNFLRLVDRIYPKLSIFYSGINENNLKSYQNLLSPWQRKNWKPLDISNRMLTCEIFYNVWQREWGNNRIYPLTTLSELLIENGFVFQNAYVGGGIDEITHTGTKAYSKEYLQFEDFRDNCIKDIAKASDEIEKEYKGWASIDYRYISVTLEKGSVKVYASDDHGLSVRWTNPDAAPLSFIEEINQKMLLLLGKNVKIQEYYSIK